VTPPLATRACALYYLAADDTFDTALKNGILCQTNPVNKEIHGDTSALMRFIETVEASVETVVKHVETVETVETVRRDLSKLILYSFYGFYSFCNYNNGFYDGFYSSYSHPMFVYSLTV